MKTITEILDNVIRNSNENIGWDSIIEIAKQDLKAMLESELENLYGGHRDVPHSDDNEMWDKAVEYCIKKVRGAL